MTVYQSPDAQAALEQSIRHLLKNDAYSAFLGIELVAARPGFAELSMLVRPELMNFHGTAHGGAIWTFADLAFGSAGRHLGPILTVESNLSFLRPSPGNSVLTARGQQIARRGKTGVFQVTVGADLDTEEGVFATGIFSGRWYEPAKTE